MVINFYFMLRGALRIDGDSGLVDSKGDVFFKLNDYKSFS